MAVIEISNNGASLKIITDGVARYIAKSQIRGISIMNDNIIQLDIGQGILNNIFLPYAEVSNPQTNSVESLMETINTML